MTGTTMVKIGTGAGIMTMIMTGTGTMIMLIMAGILTMMILKENSVLG